MLITRLNQLINQVSAKINKAEEDIKYFEGARDAFQLIISELSELNNNHEHTKEPNQPEPVQTEETETRE